MSQVSTRLIHDDDGGLARILSISRVFKASKALNLAAKLDVFTAISKRPEGMTWKQLATALGLKSDDGFRGVSDFLDLLVSIDMLQRAGDGPDALYTNHPTASRYLVRGSPDYCGGILTLNNDRSYVQFEYLEEGLRGGQLPPAAQQRLPDIIHVFGQADQGTAEHFAMGMLGASLGNFRQLAGSFDWSLFTSLGDLGGSTGCMCTAVCAAHPHMQAVTYDLGAVHATAQAYVDSQGLCDRVKVQDFDFFSEGPFPGGHDVLSLGMVLHDWGIERKKQLMKKAYEALPPGGALIAVDCLIDDARRTSPLALGMSLNMMLEFGEENAFDYSFKEFTQWAHEAGFTSTQVIPLVGIAAAAVAFKAAAA